MPIYEATTTIQKDGSEQTVKAQALSERNAIAHLEVNVCRELATGWVNYSEKCNPWPPRVRIVDDGWNAEASYKARLFSCLVALTRDCNRIH